MPRPTVPKLPLPKVPLVPLKPVGTQLQPHPPEPPAPLDLKLKEQLLRPFGITASLSAKTAFTLSPSKPYLPNKAVLNVEHPVRVNGAAYVDFEAATSGGAIRIFFLGGPTAKR